MHNITILQNLIQQIIEIVHPLKIILFGSAARGEWKEGSDFDLMVVVPNGFHCRKTAQKLYESIHGIKIPFDIVVTTPSTLRKHKTTFGFVYHYALKEGKELYAA